ncbi:TSC22 domain family protein 2-like [Lepisosteus oculatus]|uniref:TSC22 domain family protein 2-like n=1 Tax=Lepisosteus oculatus TaxID=7918 RepID=UPI00371FB8AF
MFVNVKKMVSCFETRHRPSPASQPQPGTPRLRSGSRAASPSACLPPPSCLSRARSELSVASEARLLQSAPPPARLSQARSASRSASAPSSPVLRRASPLRQAASLSPRPPLLASHPGQRAASASRASLSEASQPSSASETPRQEKSIAEAGSGGCSTSGLPFLDSEEAGATFRPLSGHRGGQACPGSHEARTHGQPLTCRPQPRREGEEEREKEAGQIRTRNLLINKDPTSSPNPSLSGIPRTRSQERPRLNPAGTPAVSSSQGSHPADHSRTRIRDRPALREAQTREDSDPGPKVHGLSSASVPDPGMGGSSASRTVARGDVSRETQRDASAPGSSDPRAAESEDTPLDSRAEAGRQGSRTRDGPGVGLSSMKPPGSRGVDQEGPATRPHSSLDPGLPRTRAQGPLQAGASPSPGDTDDRRQGGSDRAGQTCPDGPASSQTALQNQSGAGPCRDHASAGGTRTQVGTEARGIGSDPTRCAEWTSSDTSRASSSQPDLCAEPGESPRQQAASAGTGETVSGCGQPDRSAAPARPAHPDSGPSGSPQNCAAASGAGVEPGSVPAAATRPTQRSLSGPPSRDKDCSRVGGSPATFPEVPGHRTETREAPQPGSATRPVAPREDWGQELVRTSLLGQEAMCCTGLKPASVRKRNADKAFLSLLLFFHSGSSNSMIAIDNKIEQAMDLVKTHLMFAVREEVEVLREKIRELSDRNAHLERENELLRTLTHCDQDSQAVPAGEDGH